MTTIHDIDAKITAPGGPFAVVEEDVLGERMNVIENRIRSLREMLEQSALHGDAEYIVLGDRRISYAQHLRMVASTARTLQEKYGIEKGDRIAILSENHPEFIVTFWAAVSLGAIAVALNGWWTPDEVRYGIENSEPKLLVADRKRIARIQGLALEIPVVEMESGYAELLDRAPDAELPTTPIAEDDPALILYTSGTTGRPKGALISHRSIIGFTQVNTANGMAGFLLAMENGETPEPPPKMSALLTAPLFHVSGLFSGAVMCMPLGGKTVWRLGRFDPEDVLRIIEKERITMWSALGNTGHRVVSHPKIGDYDLSSMYNVGSGGGPTSPSIQERIREVFPRGGANMGLGYGSSESVAVIASIGGAELREHPTSVGRVQITTEVEIRDPEGKALPEGVEGEIFSRSPYNFLGYWKNPEATAETLHPGRWLATGDVGRLEDGRLYINSRARDMILRAAENIYPVEIENRLDAHPKVAEAAVFGVDHEELGQEVKAVVVPAEGSSVDPEELAAWVAETLAKFKVPAHWEIREEPLPRNAAGKVLKNVLTGDAANTFVED